MSFNTQELVPGDMVLWYPDPTSREEGSLGWVSCRPGANTINVLVWAPESGFVEKPSVRHVDDPFWKESDLAQGWQRWGAFELHPNTIALRELRGFLTAQKVQAARKPQEQKV